MVNAPNFFPIFLFFLALQSHGEGQQNSPLTNNNLAGDSTADQKFADCCRHELKLKAKTIKDGREINYYIFNALFYDISCQE
jgi:hypothetical protein